LVFAEFEEEEGKKIILFSGNLVHEVAAEASQTLESPELDSGSFGINGAGRRPKRRRSAMA